MIIRKIAAVAVLALVGAACGGGSEPAANEPPGQTAPVGGTSGATDSASTSEGAIEVVLSEFAFEPGSFEIAAGETATFAVTNTGVVEHELRLSNEARVEEHLDGGHADEDHDETATEATEADHVDEAEDVFVLVQPGDTAELTFTAPDDQSLYTEVVCLVPGHYEAGMKAPLTISG